MNNKELLKKAKTIVEKRRMTAELDSDMRRAQIYALLPELAAIDSKKTACGTAAARLAADGQAQQAQEKLAQLRLLDEKKEALMASKGFTLADLSPRYSCAVCKDTGMHAGRPCSCVEEEAKKLRRQEINTRGSLRMASFDNFDVNKYPEKLEGFAVSPRKAMTAILRDAREYAETFGKNSMSIYMYGNAGLGKTHLALSIAGEVLNKGFDVIYVSAQSAFAQVAENRFEKGGDIFASMLAADLLVLDDLGTEFQDSYTHSMFYQLVNTRMNNRPTIYTTNICTSENLLMRYSEKIASRLMGDCHLMRFLGQDIRLMK